MKRLVPRPCKPHGYGTRVGLLDSAATIFMVDDGYFVPNFGAVELKYGA
jgi:hypothetical protein